MRTDFPSRILKYSGKKEKSSHENSTSMLRTEWMNGKEKCNDINF